jgi:hypothetical protein
VSTDATLTLDASFRPLVISWFLALIAGVGIGLFLAWYAFPVRYTNAEPFDLGAHDKDEMLRMIASSYAVDNAFEIANTRLYYLQLPDVKARIEQLARDEPNVLTQQALIKLRLDLNNPRSARARPTYTPRPTRNLTPAPRVTVVVLEPTPVLPTTVLPSPAPTSIPPTSLPNLSAPRFELVAKRALDCPALGGGASIRVEVQDVAGNGLPGVVVEVNSALGNEQFFTGLKPEKGMGFGDVTVVPGVYSAHLVENAQSDVINDLRIDTNVVECGSNPSATQGWHLVFRQVGAP